MVLSGTCTCQPRLQTSHRPDGKIADKLALTHACTTANASVNYRRYVPQRPSKVPIARMGFSHILRVRLQGGGVYVERGTVTFDSCTITGNTAYIVRAHAQKFPSPQWDFTCFALLLAGRRCVHRRWHGELLIVHHHWQLSWKCACSHSKVPIAPMGKMLTSCFDSRFAQLGMLRSTTVCTCRRDLQKFPSPRWDFHMFRALCLQGGGVYIGGGTVSFSSCAITGNTAAFVRAHAQKFPSPRWENALMTCPTESSGLSLGICYCDL